ncbi:hypothetical protein GF342_00790 [Candidatus Woesearchaeota archaeon]|nr:hypothetical protein [Candidatus Woesearchaeota archaeon]
MMDDVQRLGGNIDLAGFRDVDGGSMIVVKKIVGTYAKKFSTRLSDFERLELRMKPIHSSEDGPGAYELKGKLVYGGRSEHVENTDHNLFYALDSVLKKLEKLSL